MSIFSLLTGGFGGGAMIDIASIVGGVFDLLITNKDEAEKLKVQLYTLQMQGKLAEMQAAVMNTASARAMQTQTRSKAVMIMAWVVILSFFVIFYIYGQNPLYTGMFIGAGISAFMTVLGFYYGGSAGQADQSVLLSQHLQNLTNQMTSPKEGFFHIRNHSSDRPDDPNA
jgi:hypothetical protein